MKLPTLAALVFGSAILAAAPAHSGETGDFLDGIEAAFASYREAASYLRTGNVDLAALQLEDMAETWSALRERFEKTPPESFVDNPLFASTIADTGTAIKAALNAIDTDDAKAAAKALAPIPTSIGGMRRASGFYRMGDCIADAGKAMDALFVHKTTPPDLTDRTVAADVIAKGAVYAYVLKKCDAMAPQAMRGNDEFRRLFDGADASLARIPEAANTENGNLLYRLLIELKSFDRLIFFRFG
ncbi:MAG: hypothetical protein C0606_02995 [Hyphomicrobiales bacterium]|nr:MAG: hypothetical protein C0606_02995 [Hyphomicrobiales bacterium]